MLKLAKNIVAVFIALVLLITISGFTVFHHSCQTEKTHDFSFFIPSFDCYHIDHHDHSGQSCCSIVDMPEQKTFGPDQCCSTETILVKLSVSFDLQDVSKRLMPAIQDILAEDHYSELISDNPVITTIIYEAPPPVVGKALHIFLNQLNIPPYPSV